MTMTFLLFFGFVVNIGHLVNAKINLQNAADLAAYAGAAVQARQMTQVSYLNYEMRRQLKKFLFRYYVLGNMSQVDFPRDADTAGGSTAMYWSPNGKNPQDGFPSLEYGVPVVCIITNPSDNYCQVSRLKGIAIPPSTPADPVNETLIQQLKAIENIRKESCKNIGATNKLLLQLWLYNTDPNLKAITAQFSGDAKLSKSFAVLTGLGQGLGLIPRELILRKRIGTLTQYLNTPAREGVTTEMADSLMQATTQAEHERTLQAFFSAYYTLGNHTFDAGSIRMDELLPKEIFKVTDIATQFDTYALDLLPKNQANVGGEAQANSCDHQVYPEIVRQNVVLGVVKDPKILTYYAIRLKASAKLLFNPLPFGNQIELKAYAAARPFGSRIGPPLTANDFLRRDAVPKIDLKSGGVTTGQNVIPNLPVRAQDSTDTGKGWDTRQVLGTFYRAFGPDGGGALPTSLGPQNIEKAYQAAMAPNPWENTRYNIPNDQGGDLYVQNFDTDHILAFWAPVVPPDKAGSFESEIQQQLDEVFGDDRTDKAAQTLALRNKIKEELIKYVESLKKGEGEEGDGLNIVRLTDPFYYRPGAVPGGTGFAPIQLPPWLMPDKPELFRSSWGRTLNVGARKAGRVGYSVKYVSFQSLQSKSTKTDGVSTPTNGAPGDGDDEAGADVERLQH